MKTRIELNPPFLSNATPARCPGVGHRSRRWLPLPSLRPLALFVALGWVLFLGVRADAQTGDTPLGVTSDMLLDFEKSLFIYTPTYGGFADPIPYGIVTNLVDTGWIWQNDSQFSVDFAEATVVGQFRVWCSYVGAGGDTGARGALWAIEYSDNNDTWTQATVFNYMTGPGLGANDDGSFRADSGGWYGCKFNNDRAAHRYWRVRQTAVTLTHAPRTSTVEFLGPPSLPFVVSTAPAGEAVRSTATLTIQLQDGLTAVATNSIQLSLNGAAVTPVVSKPTGSSLTTITYSAPGGLPAATNTVSYTFANNASPAVLQTFVYSFVVIDDAVGTLVVNIDFKGIRNGESGSQTNFPVYSGQGSAGGGSVWNGIVADSRLAGGTGNNDSLTINGANLLNSIGSPTSIGFSASAVGGNADAAYTTNETDGAVLMNDVVFNNAFDNFAGLSPFTITGLGDVPSVNLYFYLSSGTVTISGVTPKTFTGAGIYVWPNTLYPLFFENVLVVDGKVSGWFGKGSAMVGGLTIQKPALRPYILAVSPTSAGQTQTPTIEVQLQDYVTQVIPGSIQLLVNNQVVTPAVNKSGALTTVTYTPTASLPPNKNTVRIIFGDSSTPAVLQTNDFSFGVAGADLLRVTPAMLSGAATFMATADAYKSFKDPVPYGCANNATDAGWIWVDNDYFVVDFGAPTIVRQFRVYCTYPGNQAPDSGDTGERGAIWSIDYSDDTNSWSQSTEFSFESAPGKGIQDDGSTRTDCVGWYGTNFNSQAEAHRFWRISQTGVLLKHAPRGAQAEFYGQITTPIVKSTAPSDGGNARTSVIKVELQDSLTQVAANSIQLWLNGKSVTPAIAKPAGTNVTMVTYDPQGSLPVGLNEVTCVFANSASPAVSVTNSFSFTVVPDDYLVVTPDMINGSTTFFATPAGVNIGSPIPYGFANNIADNGWIWNDGSFISIDFGAPTALKKLRAYSVYTLDAFAANWVIEYSNDQASFTKCADFAFENAVGAGLNEDGTARDDCAGWYQTTFNESGVEGRYWRIRQTEILIGTHAPRVAQVEFYGKIAAVAPLKLTYQRQASSLVLSWTGTATLQSAEQIKGPWTDVSTDNPQTINTTSSGKFYRLRQ